MNNPLPSGDTCSISPSQAEQLEQVYHFKRSPEIWQFLQQHAFVISLLLEAPSHVYFDRTARVLANLDELLLLQNALARVESALEGAEGTNL